MHRKLKYLFPVGKVHTCILLSILNPLGLSPGEFWWQILDFRKWEVFLLRRWGQCASLSQLTTSLDYSFCFLFMKWHSKFWYCPHWEAWWETENYVVLDYGKKPMWNSPGRFICGDPQLQVLPASCFPPCMAHFWHFLNIPSVSFIYTLLQLSTYTPVQLQKNMAHENTSQRDMPGARVRRRMSETLPKAPNFSQEAGCKYTVEVTKL